MDIVSLYRNMRFFIGALALGGSHGRALAGLTRVYHDLDRDAARFRRASRMNCPENCGKCCENPYVEVSTLEMLPLAGILWKRKRPDLWIKKLERLPQQGRCVFYRKISGVEGRGRCRVYVFRPLMCRLFGFCAKINKWGQKQLVTCQVFKRHMAVTYTRVSAAINQNMDVPSMNDYRSRVMSFDPAHGVKLYSLPEALREAMSVVAFLRERPILNRLKGLAGSVYKNSISSATRVKALFSGIFLRAQRREIKRAEE